MIKEILVENHAILVSDSFEQTDEKCVYEPAFRRWLVRQIEEQYLTTTYNAKAIT